MMVSSPIFWTFGERLRVERARLGLSSAALAQVVGVSRNTQINYEAGNSVPDLSYLVAATGAGVDFVFVLTGLTNAQRTAEVINWQMLEDLLVRVDEWASHQDPPPSPTERIGLIKMFYTQFCDSGNISALAVSSTFNFYGARRA
jgi:transcriptional regulator with XRE-family HTH domain